MWNSLIPFQRKKRGQMELTNLPNLPRWYVICLCLAIKYQYSKCKQRHWDIKNCITFWESSENFTGVLGLWMKWLEFFLETKSRVQIIKDFNLFLQYCFGESISYSLFYFSATSLCFHGLFLPLSGKCLRTSGLPYLPLCLQSLGRL